MKLLTTNFNNFFVNVGPSTEKSIPKVPSILPSKFLKDLNITEMIKASIDSGKFGCGIFIDLRKAFDTVNHEILLNKLEHYGVRDSMLNWFKSYLIERKQYISFNGQSSELLINNCGVPQGSVHCFFYIHQQPTKY